MSTQEHFWTLRISWEYVAMVLWGNLSAHECSRVLMSAHCAMAPCSRMCMIDHDCLRALKGAHDRTLVLMCVHGAMIISVEGCSWALMSTKSTTEHSSVLISTIEHGANAWWALVSPCEHSSALVSTHEHSSALIAPWQHTLVQKGSWVLMSAQDCS